jgi:hypothetical protein
MGRRIEMRLRSLRVLRELVVKEAVVLALLFAIGSGFAAQLRPTDLPGARLLLAPAFGLAAAACTMVSLNFVVPLGGALWYALLPMALGSATWAVLTARRRGELRLRPRQLLVVAILMIAGTLTLNHPLDARNSPGPLSYGIFDAPQYISFTRGFADYTNAKPLTRGGFDYAAESLDATAWGSSWDLTLRVGWGLKWIHTGAGAVAAALAEGLSWQPWRTQAPFSLSLLLVAMLSAAGLARSLTPRLWWPALATGAAVGGPVLFSVWGDGSQGLLSGVALLPAVLAVGATAILRPRWMHAGLLGLLLAGVQTCYPEIFPQTCVSLVGFLVLRALVEHRRRGLGRADLHVALPMVLAVVALALVLTPRATLWTFEYVRQQVANGRGVAAGTPGNLYSFDLFGLLPWIVNARDFYAIAFGGPRGLRADVLNLVLPLSLIGVGLAMAVRKPAAQLLLVFAGLAVVQGILTSESLDCSYCTGRTLLVLAPVLAAIIWTGIAALRLQGPRWRDLGTVLGTLAAVAGAATMYDTTQRLKLKGVVASPDLTPILGRVQDLDGTVQLEGFDSVPYESWSEQPLTYEAVRETTGRRVSTAASNNTFGGFHFTGVRPISHPAFDPGYRYVLSRFGALQHGRQDIYRHGPLVLARRAIPFDVTVARGPAVDPGDQDPAGNAWLQRTDSVNMIDRVAPMVLWTSALSPARGSIWMDLEAPPETRVVAVGVRQRRVDQRTLRACIPIEGTGSRRVTTFNVTPAPPEMTGGPNGRASPAKVIRLAAIGATTTPCTALRSNVKR